MAKERIVYILIPVYNETRNIALLADNLLTSLPDEQMYFVFVDDASSDASVDYLNQYFSSVSHVVLTKEKNIGPGDSFNKGFEWILNHSSNNQDIVITMEADNTSEITLLATMLTISDLGYDLVLASVYAQGGGFVKTSIVRKLLSLTANLFFRVVYNIKVLTLSSFYRIYHIEMLRKIKSEYITIIEEPGFISMLEILLKAIKLNARIIEVPMVLDTSKRVGKSNMRMIKTAFSYIRILLKKRTF